MNSHKFDSNMWMQKPQEVGGQSGWDFQRYQKNLADEMQLKPDQKKLH